MTSVGSDAAKSAKALAQQAAKQVAAEPFEILKTAKSQVAGEEVLETTPQGTSQTTKPQPTRGSDEKTLKEKVKEKDMRLIQALEAEIKEIRELKRKKEEEGKIQEAQKAQAEEEPKPLVEPTTKKSRRLFGFGQKTQAERLKTRVEKPLPPSG